MQVFDRLSELAAKERSDIADSRGSKRLWSREGRQGMKIDVVHCSSDEVEDVLYGSQSGIIPLKGNTCASHTC